MKNLTEKFSLNNVFYKYFSFFDGKYINKVNNLELAIKVLLIVVLIETFGLFFIANTAINAYKDRAIEISVVKEPLEAGNKYVYEKNTGSKSAFEVLGFAALDKLNNYTYRNYKWNAEWTLKFVHPSQYDEIYMEIAKDVDFVVANRVEQVFEIKDYEYKSLSDSTVKITAIGFLKRTVGGVEVIRNKVYRSSVTVHIKNYQPFISNLDMIYADSKRVKREDRLERLENYDIKENSGKIKDEKKIQKKVKDEKRTK